ncbi:GNAT family N-acetyltransferase [Nocardioides sp. SR21]|uniref:GNAT family N-acetyltransferase n=1 Tax=Nocardioides sp. SR21 TaxID=2919501 RepID=UPI001FAB21CD|nr:GNAT family N-acetyltransferase [Nocardioides sp. SR21]
MTSLDRPDLRFRASWEEAVAEFAAAEDFMHGSGVWDFEVLDTSEDGAPAVVAHLLAQADPAVAPPEGRVHCTYFWITDDGEFVGYLALRHSLTAWLLEEGGHIGYAVRPSRRREGHASRALRLAVAEAAELGIDRALVTCDDDNDGSRAVIERAGGVYEDTRNGKRRYWIDTGPSAGGTSPRTARRAAPA